MSATASINKTIKQTASDSPRLYETIAVDNQAMEMDSDDEKEVRLN